MKSVLSNRPSYHPSVLLKLYLYGYLNRIQSSRRLERECQRNVELMWLTGRLAPDFKTIADFRRDNGKGIRNVCRRLVILCRELKLFTEAVVAIDGSNFKAVNNRERNFMPGKIERRERELEESIQRYLDALETRIAPSQLKCRPRGADPVCPASCQVVIFPGAGRCGQASGRYLSKAIRAAAGVRAVNHARKPGLRVLKVSERCASVPRERVGDPEDRMKGSSS